MTFTLSLLLLVWTSLLLSARFGCSRADGFWIFVAGAMLQVGAVTSLTSLLHQLTPGAWLLAQAFILALTLGFTGGVSRSHFHCLPAGWNRLRSGLTAFVAELSPFGLMALIAIGGILTLSAVMQMATPIHAGDEKVYHASRVIYWIQQRTALPFATHNIRQTITPFGSELFFLWPVLLTKSELIGRLVFWMAYPLAAAGQYFLLRTLKLNRTIAMVGVLILVSTPLVASSAIGLKPELWYVLSLLGTAYWAATICLGHDGTPGRYFFLGLFTVLGINIRAFPVAILPSLILIIWWTRSSFSFLTRLKAVVAGLVCGCLMSALLIPVASNFSIYDHPLGPLKVRQQVEADITPRVIYTHAVRFAFLLLELPDVAVSAEMRNDFSASSNNFISAIGAGVPLLWEDERPWPGRFVYSLPEQAKRFSLWGLLWIPTLLTALLLLIRNVATTWPRVQLTAVSALSLLAIPLLSAVLFGARWMAQSEVPARFLVGPYSLMLAVGIAIFCQNLSARKFAWPFCAIIILYSVYQPFSTQIRNAIQAVAAPVSEKEINQPFAEALELMPPGSRMIFVGNRDAPDYPLFSPGTQFSNAVIPWGLAPFDPARMRRLIDSEKATHVLIQDVERVPVVWHPPLDIMEMMNWMTQEPGLKAVPLDTPRMRLFETAYSTELDERRLQRVEVPSGAPLLTIDTTLRTQVGINPSTLKTPWPVENHGGAEGGFLWIGQGYGEGVEFGLWSRQDQTVDIRFNVSPGHSLTTPDRKIKLLHDDVPVGDERTFSDYASIVFRVRLRPGRNVMSFFAEDSATIRSMPNGDTRHLVVGLHEIRVESAPANAAVDARTPARTDPGNNDAEYAGLALSARKAAGLISRHQQIDGYWLTSYTSGESFEHPRLEMNTFVTSLMVDILGPQAASAGLRGSLERARTHLRDQIEAGGLVRYHGRPDAPAMAALGLCTITPDADDTALVWRIAPGDHAMRSSAVATLMRYRTDDGLYKTWLGQAREYRCINPGSDPNPTDVGIQMHVLMLLAQADPAAAHSLCSALRQAIGQDRHWAYYHRTPLIPLLRLAAVQSAGCQLQLPSSRLQTSIPGQGVWLGAARMLQQFEGSEDSLPTSDQVRALLRELSKDDFSPLRQTPPLLYHNDLTASVRRFYWSEDAGYAIWLRLYLEGVRHGLLNASRGSEEARADGPAVRKPS